MNTFVQNPKVSIIVPIYNVGKYLEKCIVSILNQDYDNLEILLIDDGSSDNSSLIINKFTKIDSRIKAITKNNSGVASTRNVGLINATGDYVCFSDGDDFLENNYVSYLISLITLGDYDIALTTHLFIGDDNHSIKERIHPLSSKKAISMLLYDRIPIGVYSKLFKMSFIKNKDIIFDNSLFMGEGLNFNALSFYKTTKIIASTKKIYHYRTNNSTSACSSFSMNKCLNALEGTKKVKMTINSSLIKPWDAEQWSTLFFVYCWAFKSNHEIENKTYIHEWEKQLRKYSFPVLFSNCKFKTKIKVLLFVFFPIILKKLLKGKKISPK
jgi:glycosyltransferase involved in cell wall biosynthesis